MMNQRGFTLIELLVVITIVGILAATALPRFIDVGSDARIAAIRGLEGAATSSVSMISAAARMRNIQSGAVAVDGVPVILAGGVPVDAVELIKILQISDDYTVVGDSIRHRSAIVPENCGITYLAGVVTRQTGGC